MPKEAAYNLKDFERKPKAQKETELQVVKKSKPEKKRSSVRVIFSTLLVMSVMAMSLTSNAQLATLTDEISTAETELKVLVSEATKLNLDVEGMASMSKIEAMAEANLSLVQTSDSQIKYVELETADKVEMPEAEEGFLESIWNNIKSFFNFGSDAENE